MNLHRFYVLCPVHNKVLCSCSESIDDNNKARLYKTLFLAEQEFTQAVILLENRVIHLVELEINKQLETQ